MNYNSTKENPLLFFEYIASESNIKECIVKYLDLYGVTSYIIDLPNSIHYIEDNIPNQITIEDFLLPILRIQFEKSKSLIQEKYLSEKINTQNFLQLQFSTIQSIIYNKANIINQYPFLLLPLRGIIKFINDKLLLPNINEFTLNETGIIISPIIAKTTFTNKEIIDEVLGYMLGNNNKQEIILNPKDFELLVQYTTCLIEKEEIPIIKKQLKPNLVNGVILYTFWVLHKELYTTHRIKPCFYDFISAVFENFKNTSISSIKKQFGTVRFYAHSFLPQIIKKHLN